MSFTFDGADLLVIFIVLVILFISRRLDRTGRSLEKVRRYADKTKTELDAIVRERELGLKDLSVDLEVREKTNREILARAESAKDEIISMAAKLTESVKRIEAQERALKELNTLAVHVDENLHRLKEESLYVDQLGSRLRTIKEQFNTVTVKYSEHITGMEARDKERAATMEAENRKRFLAAEIRDKEHFAAMDVQCKKHFESTKRNFQEEVGSKVDNVQSMLLESERQLEIYKENLEFLNASRDKLVEGQLDRFSDKLEDLEGSFETRIQTIVEQGSNMESEAYNSLNAIIESRTQEIQSNTKRVMEQLDNQIKLFANETEESIAKVKLDQQLFEEENTERIDGHTEKIESMEKQLRKTVSDSNEKVEDLGRKFDEVVQNKEIEMMGAAEIRQNGYRMILDRKFDQIEDFIKDMDRTKEILLSDQNRVTQEIENRFASFDVEMTEKRVEEKKQFEEAADKLKQEMVLLEKGLEDLKARAYENVSEKLQVFEDEFFANLKARDGQIKAAMDEWQKNADLKLKELSARATREREEIERRYSSQMDKDLSDFQTHILGQFSDFQGQVNGFKDSLNGRMHISETLLNGFNEELNARILEEKEQAIAGFNKSYNEFSADVEEKFSKAGKTIRQKLHDSMDEIQTKHRSLIDTISSSKEELSDWQERINLQIEETRRTTSESINLMKSDFSLIVQELKDDFSARSEQLIINSGEKQSEIKKEVGELQENLNRLSLNMDDKIRNSLELLKDQSESFLLDFRKSSRDARDEMDRKVKELRQSVQDSRERIESTRSEMVTHTDAAYTRLMSNIDDIDHRQRAFIAETKVFERADELKEGLENDITQLKILVETVTGGRDEVQRINDKYERSLILNDELNTKINRLASEHRNIEDLENKMTRINSLAESVDLKFKQVSESNDLIQVLKIRLASLEKLQESLGDGYEQLVEKSKVLDATSDGVDSSFESILKIQTVIQDVSGRIEPLMHQISSVQDRQNRIEQDRDKVEAVVGKIGSIDSTLTELDKRILGLNKAREWLAQLETRLKEMNEEMHQKFRMLDTISKKNSSRKPSGSPDMSTRDIVIQLAKQSWNIEEIARSTKLSQGEVELILELYSPE